MPKIHKKLKTKLYKKSLQKLLQKYKSKRKGVKRETRIQTGGKTVSNLVITYGNIVLIDDINGILLTQTETVNEPKININLSGKTLLIMFDENAPNGEENKTGINKNYMHMVKIYTSGKISDNDSVNDIKLAYNPPTPPKGTHNYIFKLYSVVNGVNGVNGIPKGGAGTEYFNTVNNIIQNLLNKNQLQLVSTISFKVNGENKEN
jgi:phosphatidylethanolamine-binding protein (PEBP) family uncharacterized protein